MNQGMTAAFLAVEAHRVSCSLPIFYTGRVSHAPPARAFQARFRSNGGILPYDKRFQIKS